MGAALQAFVSYPETARKSLEEIEEMFRPGGPHPWQTHVGGSKLEGHIAAAKAKLEKEIGITPNGNDAEQAEKQLDSPLSPDHEKFTSTQNDNHGIDKV